MAVPLALALALAVLAAGCQFDGSGRGMAGGDDAGGDGDGGGRADGGADDGMPPPPAVHLLLSEIKSVAMSSDSEFIEIYNPTDSAISLDEYFLSDDDSYHLYPAAVATGTDLGIDALNDFVARFPDGSTIEPGQVMVIATDQGGFEDEFAIEPDFAMGGGSAPTMDVVIGSSNPSLTDAGEPVILFRWDGVSDLVTDVDLMLVGKMPSEANRLPDKSGELVDGPDADVTATPYAAEAASIGPTADRTTPNESYERIALEGIYESATGGNGVDGHDESGEDTVVTWEQTGVGAPTPGTTPLRR